jgi:hypothetical protein
MRNKEGQVWREVGRRRARYKEEMRRARHGVRGEEAGHVWREKGGGGPGMGRMGKEKGRVWREEGRRRAMYGGRR